METGEFERQSEIGKTDVSVRSFGLEKTVAVVYWHFDIPRSIGKDRDDARGRIIQIHIAFIAFVILFKEYEIRRGNELSCDDYLHLADDQIFVQYRIIFHGSHPYSDCLLINRKRLIVS